MWKSASGTSGLALPSMGSGVPRPCPADDALSWDKSKTVLLIDLWSKSPALFDTTCIDYRDKYRRSAALNAIAGELGVQESDIRDKMRNLRSQYARERAHEQKSSVSTTLPGRFAYKSKWFYFSRLSFLDDFKRHVRSDAGKSHFSTSQADAEHSSNLHETFALCADTSSQGWRSTSPQAVYIRSASSSPADGPSVGRSPRSLSEGSEGCAAIESTAAVDRTGGSSWSPSRAVLAPNIGAKRRKSKTQKLVDCGGRTAGFKERVFSDRTSSLSYDEEEAAAAEEVSRSADEERQNGQRRPAAAAAARNGLREDDDEELFGRFIANELRRVPSGRLKTVAMLRMHEALLSDAVACGSDEEL